MIRFSLFRVSLLWKILLSTSVALTALFALTGWILQKYSTTTTLQSLNDEVKASFEAYRSLLKARGNTLASVSLILSTMSDVRAAFRTGDQATIQDTARELWSKISDENALFLVADPQGKLIASLGGMPASSLIQDVRVVRIAFSRFPKQAEGFMFQDGRLYQIAVTPVYVQSGQGSALLNALVAGYHVDAVVAGNLKEATGGSEFLFIAQGRVVASTLDRRATEVLARDVERNRTLNLVSDGVTEYAPLKTPLLDIEGKPIGELWIFRSFESARQRIAALRRNIILIWLFAMSAGLALTYLLARRIVHPVTELDLAAAQVAQQNYDYRVPVEGEDELGRLGRTFNAMCASIQKARDELIRQERISTIGRLSSSIVHDLRNPLAAIYGGAEMLVDTELSPPQVKRLGANIYRASRHIQQLLQDLLNVSRGKTSGAEVCKLREVAAAALESLHATAESQSVAIAVEVPEGIELPLQRARMERVFQNLIGNALEVMPQGGRIRISARIEKSAALVDVEDSGPGIPAEIRGKLFQPFVSAGKKNGLGLGLAMSRQTVLDHGGDMWVESESGRGARFCFSLPLAGKTAAQAVPALSNINVPP